MRNDAIQGSPKYDGPVHGVGDEEAVLLVANDVKPEKCDASFGF